MVMLLCNLTLSDWGGIWNIVLGITSVFTAIVTAYVLCKQYRLQREQHQLEKEKLDAQQMEHQPLFQFKRTDNEYIISNAGCELSAPVYVKLHSMITVQTAKLINDEWKNYIVCYPVSYYDRNIVPTGNLKGDVAIAYFKTEDHETYEKNISKLREMLFRSNYVPNNLHMLTDVHSVLASDVLEIRYTDMYNKKRTSYFWNSQPISKVRYEQLVNLHCEVPIGKYGINNIRYEDIMHLVYYTNVELA